MFERIAALFGRVDGDSIEPTTDALAELLGERERTLDLTAVYEQPYPSMQDEPTAVFPYTLYDSDDNRYGTGTREFVIPDDGTDDTTSELVGFLGETTNTDYEDVTREHVSQVEGVSADASLENGDVVVHYPTFEDETEDADGENSAETDEDADNNEGDN